MGCGARTLCLSHHLGKSFYRFFVQFIDLLVLEFILSFSGHHLKCYMSSDHNKVMIMEIGLLVQIYTENLNRFIRLFRTRARVVFFRRPPPPPVTVPMLAADCDVLKVILVGFLKWLVAFSHLRIQVSSFTVVAMFIVAS